MRAMRSVCSATMARQASTSRGMSMRPCSCGRSASDITRVAGGEAFSTSALLGGATAKAATARAAAAAAAGSATAAVVATETAVAKTAMAAAGWATTAAEAVTALGAKWPEAPRRIAWRQPLSAPLGASFRRAASWPARAVQSRAAPRFCQAAPHSGLLLLGRQSRTVHHADSAAFLAAATRSCRCRVCAAAAR